MLRNFGELASDKEITNAKNALEKNGMEVFVAENAEKAKEKVLELIPPGAEVMTMTSETLRLTGIADGINESGRYNSVRKKFESMGGEKQISERKKLGAGPDWAVGSVHAITEDGKVVIASNTGSQLPAYAYGAQHVIWVVGSQKIVKDFDEALKRVYEYVLPLEDARARKAYGEGSNVSKMLVINKEVQKGRLIMIIVKEKLGF